MAMLPARICKVNVRKNCDCILSCQEKIRDVLLGIALIQLISHTGLGTPLCRGQKFSIDVLRYHVEVCLDLKSAPAQVTGTICSERCRIALPATSPSSRLATQPAKRAASAWTARLGRSLIRGQARAAHFDAINVTRFEQETGGACGQHLGPLALQSALKLSLTTFEILFHFGPTSQKSLFQPTNDIALRECVVVHFTV